MWRIGVLLAATVLLGVGGCSTSTGQGDGGCEGAGQGTLRVAVLGLPPGVGGRVILRGPGGFSQVVTASQDLAVAAGNYLVEVERTASPVTGATVVRAAYAGMSDKREACVRNNQTTQVTVTYSQILSSAKLWLVNDPPKNGGDPYTHGYAEASLMASGTVGEAVGAGTRRPRDLTFDAEGNLWIIGGTTVDPTLIRYPAGALGTSGSKTPDRSLSVSGFTCLPGAEALAFDPLGNLWLSIPCANKVVRLSAAQLGASGSVTPGVEITGLSGPKGLAFDSLGNLWIANTGAKQVVRVNASRLGASTSGPDLTIQSRTPGPVVSTLGADRLAFDSSSNLWVAAFGANVLYRLTASEQTGSGSRTLTPGVQVSLPVSALLEGMAFDEGGGLWISYSAGRVARLSPSQLATSSTPGSPTVPDRIVEGSNLGYAGSIALYPAPAGLPLFYKVP